MYRNYAPLRYAGIKNMKKKSSTWLLDLSHQICTYPLSRSTSSVFYEWLAKFNWADGTA